MCVCVASGTGFCRISVFIFFNIEKPFLKKILYSIHRYSCNFHDKEFYPVNEKCNMQQHFKSSSPTLSVCPFPSFTGVAGQELKGGVCYALWRSRDLCKFTMQYTLKQEFPLHADTYECHKCVSVEAAAVMILPVVQR